jgi:hypothetical protein
MKFNVLLLLLLCFFSGKPGSILAQGAFSVKGIVYETDSATPIPFVISMNKNTQNGTMTDASGHFELSAGKRDTLIFSYLGYEVSRISLLTFSDSVKNNSLRLKIVLKKKVLTLQQVIITSTEFSKEEKKYYTTKIDEYERLKSQGISSPITGLYYAFSKEGKSLKKLTEMYDELLYEELLEKRLSDQKLREVTKDDRLDCKAFRDYCRISGDFLTLASEYDLFEAVVKKYRDFKSGKKAYNSVPRPR